ncbi:hypothetical protein AIOL_004395 [Candidatus Rhodobacter oscarellae]|uniref:General secretion pathway protein H n=1 Tax=Candidatus Rhodobacter oscarellae TaxID=1675527 RepID=A0A0J9H0Z2_9RHOB|nr:prepilin-type N-terminal cleavage/methylation domain-containing protein [Candidatus Rhodobacter lobularis]KMW59413.1 hypothetical protein AIOL_004395 [Candidatus Rhodobacter lobularis]
MTARPSLAGVTLIEMLVVLALFAIMAGAVVLALPSARDPARADLSALALVSALDRAAGHALATGQAFGIRQSDGALELVQQDDQGAWHPHSDPFLAGVKLFPTTTRNTEQAGRTAVYSVSGNLVPDTRDRLVVTFGSGARASIVSFDGVRAQVVRDENG